MKIFTEVQQLRQLFVMTSKLFGPGLVSPYLLADLVASVSVVYLINTLLVPVIKSYKQGKSFDHDIGSDKGHWFYGHLFKVSGLNTIT